MDQLVVHFGTDGSVFFNPSPQQITPGQVYTTSDAVIDVSFDGHSCGTDLDGGGDTGAVEVDQFTTSPNPLAVKTLALQFFCTGSGFAFTGTVAYDIVPTTPGQGYYTYGTDGSLSGFGNDNYLDYLGDLTQMNLNAPIVSMAITPDGAGYWMVGADGGVFAYGDAGFYGSTGNIHLNHRWSAWPPPPTARATGWWPPTAGSSPTGTPDSTGRPATSTSTSRWSGMAPPPTARATGWWRPTGGSSPTGTPASTGRPATSTSTSRWWAWPPPPTARATGWWPPTGGSSPTGTPASTGRPATSTSTSPWWAWRPTPDGKGYWFVAQDGGVFAYGSAPFEGSLGGQGITNVAGLATSPLPT